MNRQYANTQSDSAQFFYGTEVEHTPAYGMPTLFVVGLQLKADIDTWLKHTNATHIFWGSNYSFDHEQIDEWEDMIIPYLKEGYMCSLDVPYENMMVILESAMIEYHNFIPQIRVTMPYIGLWNYNTTIKFDDNNAGLESTNPGVWVHSLHSLKDPAKFTSWDKYQQDLVLHEVTK